MLFVVRLRFDDGINEDRLEYTLFYFEIWLFADNDLR
jgi:hypothetical protein